MPTPMPVIKTPIGMRDFALALLRTLKTTGVVPTKRAAGVFWAQYALETGAGGYCWNHNLFNHKVTQAQAAAGVQYMMLANTWEIENGKKVTYQPPHPATWFRAYASFEAALSDHIQSIKNGRYASSWEPMLAGDVHEYAAQLRAHGYFTAPLDSYQRLLAVKMTEWMRTPAYEDAIAEIIASSERETEPEIRVQDFPIVHPPVRMDSPGLDEDDFDLPDLSEPEPPEAA